MLRLMFLVVAILMASGIFAPSDADLLQFQDMVVCATPERYLSALAKYNGYGCYCGFGGDGDPVDETDKCCQAHDACYDGAKSSVLFEKYTATYHYNKWRNAGWDPKTCQITCRPASGYAIWEFNEDCKAWQCECDRQGALCFGRKASTLNVAKYGSYPQSFCK